MMEFRLSVRGISTDQGIVIEQLFSTVRHRNGFNSEPLTSDIGYTLARIASHKIRYSGQSQNYEPITSKVAMFLDKTVGFLQSD